MTSLINDNHSPSLASADEVQIKIENPEIEDTVSNDSVCSSSSDGISQCKTCQQEFKNREDLLKHLLNHVSQPRVIVQRVDDLNAKKKLKKRKSGPLRFTVRTKNNNFEIIKSPDIVEEAENKENSYPRIPKLRILLPEQLTEQVVEPTPQESDTDPVPEETSDDLNETEVNLLNEKEVKSPKLAEEPECNGDCSSASSSNTSTNNSSSNNNNNSASGNNSDREMVELKTLPNESQSPSFPGQSPGQPEVAGDTEQNSFWHEADHTDGTERIQESGEKEAETHNNLLQNFLNDTVDNTPKDTGINSNDTEYISLERLAGPRCPVCRERCIDQSSLDIHQKAMGHYPPNSSIAPYGQPPLPSIQSSPLDTLANLPMQQLAQQVNRLQQGAVHQQNVLINIQQFGQPMPPPPPQYGRAPNIPPPYTPQHYPPQSQAAPPHIFGGYHPPPPPHPPHPIYYPPSAAGMYPPMAHDRSRQPIQHQYAPPSHHPPNSMMPPRAPPLQQRMAPPPPPTTIHHRPRARMAPMSGTRNGGPRPSNPRQPMPSGMRPNMPQQPRPMRRPGPSVEQQQNIKRKRMDVLIPDTNDNDDCHVISMQKCNDGLPVIKNVQGATSSANESDPIVHLTDSITLSVRNPKEAPVVQKKSNDAKSVANILATRGITVTPAAKNQRESPEPKRSAQTSNSPPVAINLNNAVSIIPTARASNAPIQTKNGSSQERMPKPPTVDLTDDEPAPPTPKSSPSAATISKRALPHQCDLCPAQYPTLHSLMNHRRTYHKTGPQNELGVPVVDLRQPAVLNKLSSLGIHNYIPLPQLGGGNSSFGLPIVSLNATRNPNICNIGALGSGAVLPLGPLRHISNLSKQ